MPKKKKVCWQLHHLSYEPEITRVVRRSVHFYLTKLQRFSGLSQGEKEAFMYIIQTKPTVAKEE